MIYIALSEFIESLKMHIWFLFTIGLLSSMSHIRADDYEWGEVIN